MAENFDPYHRWLSIPPKLQPASYYRLLGLELFESNADVIEAAADRQMGYVRTFQAGKHSALSQKLLNEIAAARLCLLNPVRRADYDARLKAGESASAAADAVPPPDADGAAFGEYLLLDLLGSGWLGQVFLAQHRTMGRVVALKILSTEATKSPELVARFHQKISLLARLKHDNLVAAFDAGERDGVHFLTMEHVDGWDLLQLIKEYGTLPVENVVDYTIQAAAGLGYAHEQGIFHRNLKPGNVLVDKQGIVKVIGWGVARFGAEASLAEPGVAAEVAEQHGRLIGTVEFMSPEQARDSSHADARSDIYGLGCTLFTTLTNRMLFPGKTTVEKIAAHHNAPIPLLRSLRRDVSPGLDAVFQKMVAKRPEHRFQSMDEVSAALRSAQAQSGPATAASSSVAAVVPADPVATSPEQDELSNFLSNLSNAAPQPRKK